MSAMLVEYRWLSVYSCWSVPRQQTLYSLELARSAFFACFSSQVGYLYGYNPFSIGVWIRLNITALPAVPNGVFANRKNFMFCDSVKGAESSAIVYSLSIPREIAHLDRSN